IHHVLGVRHRRVTDPLYLRIVHIEGLLPHLISGDSDGRRRNLFNRCKGIHASGAAACRFLFFQAEDGIRDRNVTGVQTCALPILSAAPAAQTAGDGSAAAVPPGYRVAACTPSGQLLLKVRPDACPRRNATQHVPATSPLVHAANVTGPTYNQKLAGHQGPPRAVAYAWHSSRRRSRK